MNLIKKNKVLIYSNHEEDILAARHVTSSNEFSQEEQVLTCSNHEKKKKNRDLYSSHEKQTHTRIRFKKQVYN